MVIASHTNWERHKNEVHEVIKQKYGKKKADIFMNFYLNRYDKHKRSFLYYKVCMQLIDDYYAVKNGDLLWYAAVGDGGTGKSTLMKNVMSFLDPTMDLSRVNLKTVGFLKALSKFPTTNAVKAVFMDEPDDRIHTSSRGGKILREVIGKQRQQQLFLGICATSISDIPLYIFRRISRIFFLPYKGKAIFFKNQPKKGIYPIQEIRKSWGEKGYKVFYDLKRNKNNFISFSTSRFTPFTKDDEKGYLKYKKDDYKDTLKECIGVLNKKGDGLLSKPIISDKEKIIIKMKEKGLTQEKIGTYVGYSRQRIQQILANATSPG